jgi:hypothetical protein
MEEGNNRNKSENNKTNSKNNIEYEFIEFPNLKENKMDLSLKV